jgi:hypothetical protein
MARFDISQYMTVAQRIDLFWARYPDGRLHTEVVHFSPDQVVIKAEVFLDRTDERPVTIDFAEERPETSPVNRVSMVENCATSALGRALADLGNEFTGSKRPSAEEMEKVQRFEEKKRDWIEEASKLSDKDALRLLWAEASQAGASTETLEAIRERADSLGVDGKPARAGGGVSSRPKKS